MGLFAEANVGARLVRARARTRHAATRSQEDGACAVVQQSHYTQATKLSRLSSLGHLDHVVKERALDRHELVGHALGDHDDIALGQVTFHGPREAFPANLTRA